MRENVRSAVIILWFLHTLTASLTCAVLIKGLGAGNLIFAGAVVCCWQVAQIGFTRWLLELGSTVEREGAVFHMFMGHGAVALVIKPFQRLLRRAGFKSEA